MPSLTQSNIGGPPPVHPELPPGGGGGDGDGGRGSGGGSTRAASMTAIIVVMCASFMTFGAFLSAMVIRRGLSNDWHKFALPRILWYNTIVLILSSIAIEAARRMLKRGRRSYFTPLWTIATVLGTLFLIGQFTAWNQLAAQGVFLVGNPSSAFFHVMTWAHAAHVVGALLAVIYVEFLALKYELGTRGRTWVDASSLFWHFLDVLWLGIMALFVFWA
ncbi:MAG: cytochrome c oxidase, subunit [Bryobacterales bacterium]|nr:cytochrome c oxidase, subunit [Bryobacterales bacterium]